MSQVTRRSTPPPATPCAHSVTTYEAAYPKESAPVSVIRTGWRGVALDLFLFCIASTLLTGVNKAVLQHKALRVAAGLDAALLESTATTSGRYSGPQVSVPASSGSVVVGYQFAGQLNGPAERTFEVHLLEAALSSLAAPVALTMLQQLTSFSVLLVLAVVIRAYAPGDRARSMHSSDSASPIQLAHTQPQFEDHSPSSRQRFTSKNRLPQGRRNHAGCREGATRKPQRAREPDGPVSSTSTRAPHDDSAGAEYIPEVERHDWRVESSRRLPLPLVPNSDCIFIAALQTAQVLLCNISLSSQSLAAYYVTRASGLLFALFLDALPWGGSEQRLEPHAAVGCCLVFCGFLTTLGPPQGLGGARLGGGQTHSTWSFSGALYGSLGSAAGVLAMRLTKQALRDRPLLWPCSEEAHAVSRSRRSCGSRNATSWNPHRSAVAAAATKAPVGHESMTKPQPCCSAAVWEQREWDTAGTPFVTAPPAAHGCCQACSFAVARWTALYSFMLLVILSIVLTKLRSGVIRAVNVLLTADGNGSLLLHAAIAVATAPLVPILSSKCLTAMSPTSCVVAGFCKAVLQVAAGTFFFGEALYAHVIAGVTMCFLGATIYAKG